MKTRGPVVFFSETAEVRQCSTCNVDVDVAWHLASARSSVYVSARQQRSFTVMLQAEMIERSLVEVGLGLAHCFANDKVKLRQI